MDLFYRFFCERIKIRKIAYFCSLMCYFLFKIVPFLFKRKIKINNTNYIKLNYQNGRIKKLENKYMNKDYDLSIIIACYNSEKYIKNCLDSCLNQKTSYKFEIIVVDDGSTDNTKNICKQYQNKIKLISINNNKQGYARNRGIENSRGKNIAFVDSDDMITEDFVETIVSNIKNVDILHFGYYLFENNNFDKKREKKYVSKSFFSNINNKSLKLITFFNDGLIGNKAFKYNIISEYGFPEKIFFEDTVFNMFWFPISTTYKYLPKSIYYYRIHDSQETKQVSTNTSSINQFCVSKLIYSFLIESKFRINKEYLINAFFSNISTILYERTKNLNYDFQYSLFYDMSLFIRDNFKNDDKKKLPFKEKKLFDCLLKQDFAKYLKVQKYL